MASNSASYFCHNSDVTRHKYFQKVTCTAVVGLDTDGYTVDIPRAQMLVFVSELRDWRHVRVSWKGQPIRISRTAWESCADWVGESTHA